MNEEQYIQYFRQLATLSNDIKHTELKQRFFYNDDDTHKAVEDAMRSKLHLPCLVLDSFGDGLLTENDNFRTEVIGGFTILCKAVAGDTESRRQAREQARAIGLKFLHRFRYDCLSHQGSLYLRKAKPELNFEGSEASLNATAVGWAYEIRLTVPASVKVQPADWSDL